MRTIAYADPTGETAVGNVMKEEKRKARLLEKREHTSDKSEARFTPQDQRPLSDSDSDKDE